MIRDPDAYAELREIELDLLDAAARGTLDPTRGDPAIERIAAAPHNRSAGLLAQALAERRAREQGGVSWRWSVAWPAAAALIGAVGMGLFLLRTAPADRPGAGRGAGTSPSAVTARRNPPEAPHAVPPANTASPAGTVSRDRQPPPSAGSPPSSSDVATNAPSRAAPAAAPNVPANAAPTAGAASADPARMVALFLPAGTLRGDRPAVRVPRDTETVQLEIEIESPAPPFVTVTLRAVSDPAASNPSSSPPPAPASSPSPSTAAVWTAVRVPVRTDRGQRLAVVTLPARVLPFGAIEAHVTTPARAGSSAPTPASTPIRIIPFLVRRG